MKEIGTLLRCTLIEIGSFYRLVKKLTRKKGGFGKFRLIDRFERVSSELYDTPLLEVLVFLLIN
jgi:hypothetical protein